MVWACFKKENDWVKKCMDFEVEEDLEAGRGKLGVNHRKRLSDLTNMQGRCHGP